MIGVCMEKELRLQALGLLGILCWAFLVWIANQGTLMRPTYPKNTPHIIPGVTIVLWVGISLVHKVGLLFKQQKRWFPFLDTALFCFVTIAFVCTHFFGDLPEKPPVYLLPVEMPLAVLTGIVSIDVLYTMVALWNIEVNPDAGRCT